VKNVSDQVSENWDKLEPVVEGRVNEILGGIGIPSKDDLGKLSAELNKLTRQVAAMDKKLKAVAKTAPRKAAAKKPAAPKTVVGKTPSLMAAVKKAPAPKAAAKKTAATKAVTTKAASKKTPAPKKTVTTS